MSDPTETPQEPTAPETPDNGAGQQNAVVVGELTEGENNTLRRLQAKASEIMLRIGQMERTKMLLLLQAQDTTPQVGQVAVQQAQALAQYGEITSKAQRLLNEAAKRMDIPDGQQWQVTPEGKAIIIEAPAEVPPPQ